MDSTKVLNNINAGSNQSVLIPIGKEYDNVQYQGTVSMRYGGSIKDTISIGLEQSKLRQGTPENQLDKVTAFFTEALAFLKILVTELPDNWGKVDDLPAELIGDIYAEYVDKIKFFRSGDKSESTSNTATATS